MADVNISKYRASVVREGSKPASPGFVVSEGQDPVNPPGTNNFVPYTGATANVELGEFGVEAGFVTLDTTPTNIPTDQGAIYWDDTRSTAALIMNGTLQHIGQDSFFYVKNSSGSTIPKGTCVGFAGTEGGSGHLLITPFIANGSVPSTYFMGVTCEAIANGAFGQVMHFGELEGINTSGFTAGALLYASSTVAGAFQTTAPVAPNNIILVAAAVNSKNNGAIVVRPTLGSNFETNESVKLTSVTDKDLLQYTVTAGIGVWENKTLSQVIGSAYVPSTRTLTINGVTQDLSANRTFNVGDMLLGEIQTVTARKDFNSNTLNLAINGTSQKTILTNSGIDSGSYSGAINAFGFNASNNLYFSKGGNNNGIFAFSNAATRTYTLKDASGTLAFTSDIPSLSGYVQGSGTTNYLPKFTSSTTIGNSNLINDASGNLGLGVTPSSWATTSKAIQFGTTGILENNNGGSTYFGYNAFRSSGGGWIYLTNSFANIFGAEANGDFAWYNASSGTAGNSISFAERFRITQGGDANFNGRIKIENSSTPSGGNAMSIGGASSGGYAYLQSWNSQPITLNPLGNNVLIGTTTDNGAKLQVSGTAQATKLVSASNAFAGTLDFGTGSFKGIMDYTASTGLWSLNNQTAGASSTAYFQFQADSSPILTMLKSGNVGIGTASPSQKLVVQESGDAFIQIRNNSVGQNFFIGALNGEARLNNDNNTPITMWVNGTERMRITSTGFVSAGATTNGRLGVRGFTNDSSGYAFEAANASGNSLFLVRNDGNVGVGGIPTTLFYVEGSAPIFTMNRTAGGFINRINFSSGGTNYASIISDAGAGEQRYSIGPSAGWGGYHTFYTDTAERMRITSAGYLVLGATSSVYGTSGRGTFEMNGSGDNILAMRVNGILGGYLYTNASSMEIYSTNRLDISTAGAVRASLTTGGNLLLGTITDSGDRLRVNGSIRTANTTNRTADSWRLGDARIDTIPNANRLIRVQIGSVEYDILARQVI